MPTYSGILYWKVFKLKMSLSVVFGSWFISVTFYFSLFLSSPNFFFNTNSGACEVFPSSHARLTFAGCFLYFPTTMIMMYCYGTAFHTDTNTIHRLVGAIVTAPQLVPGTAMNPVCV
ncbi:hypothetical protein Anas_11443 [Armadillidium nasatum]|uniref:Uncharacterized protein n=1 Tax=Armadillidium nasatum TaxID=96803 RepID=A0A5N5TFP9_9CRUS|nr:hypothetical protein Anas_11443 [Armadillidium nasatum]